jgi:AbrB family looped-hinge helix DNA binding protein
MKVRMDSRGRILLPKIVRERLKLAKVNKLELLDLPDGVLLKPVKPAAKD